MEDKELKEFSVMIKKAVGPKKMKVTNSWGVYDAYRFIRKNKWYDIGSPVKSKDFYAIIRMVNDLLKVNLSQGAEVVFPFRMGKLELRKLKRGVSLVDGKVRVTYPVNWDETIRLWLIDEEARKNKTKVRFEDGVLYRIKYVRHDANYNNKSFYEFVLNRKIKKGLKENIKKGLIDTLWSGK